MFTSPYSPFFTSGLLSEPLTSRPASPDVPLSLRRGSLPTDSSCGHNTTGSAALTSVLSDDHASAFYFTLQPRRDEEEFRSFLSLDLAESRSMRSASLKRKASKTSRKAVYRFPRISEVPPPIRTSTPAPPAPPRTPLLRLRFSRDSLRSIPSPKPVPSITLPDVPLQDEDVTTPAPVASPVPSTSALPSASTSALLPVTSNRTRTPSPSRGSHLGLKSSFDFPSPPPSSSRTPPKLSIRISRTSHPYPHPHPYTSQPKRMSTVTSSTVSTRVRRYNRSEALAALEGRGGCRSAPLPLLMVAETEEGRNFMSMSDDEDEQEDSDSSFGDDEDDGGAELDFDFEDISTTLGALNIGPLDLDLDFGDITRTFDALMEPEDLVLPEPSSSSRPAFLEAPRSAPVPPSSSRRTSRLSPSPSHTPTPTHSAPSPTPSSRRTSSTRATAPSSVRVRRKASRTKATSSKDWFPLKSFIDLHNDDSLSISTGQSRSSKSASLAVPGTGSSKRTSSSGSSERKDVKSSRSKQRDSGSGSGWMWRSFIEVAHVS